MEVTIPELDEVNRKLDAILTILERIEDCESYKGKTSDKKLLSVHETASMLGIQPMTLYKWVSAKEIPYVKLGSRILFRADDLEEFILANRKEPIRKRKRIVDKGR